MSKILVAEDELAIARLIELELKREGFAVEVFHDGENAYLAAMKGEYDLLLLDIMMPGMDGIEVLRRLREHSDLPIIMLTAKGALSDKVEALGLGADDYIVKPFAMEEVTARVRSALRRSMGNPRKPSAKNGGLTVDKATCSVFLNGQGVELTKKEYELAVYFMENRGRVCSREELLKNVWGFDYAGDTNLVDVYIRYLRSKIDNVCGEVYFKTVRGFGYVMEDKDE